MAETKRAIANHFESRADDLRQRLFAHSGKVYIFVDPLLVDPFDRRLWGTQALAQVPHVIRLRRTGLSKEQCPYFFEVASPLDDLLEYSLALAEAQATNSEQLPSLCGWFVSNRPPHTIEAVLHGFLERRLADGRRYFLRFYDPRVLRHMARVMGAAFKLPGVQSWTYLDHQGSLQYIEGDDGAHDVTELTPVQRQAIDRIGLVNQAFDLWRAQDRFVASTTFPMLDAAIVKAHKLGLPQAAEADCIAFALHCCLIHPNVEKHPAVAEWIARARAGEQDYVDAASVASEALWADIASGHWEDSLKETRHG